MQFIQFGLYPDPKILLCVACHLQPCPSGVMKSGVPVLGLAGLPWVECSTQDSPGTEGNQGEI